jgi:hypothetical protein
MRLLPSSTHTRLPRLDKFSRPKRGYEPDFQRLLRLPKSDLPGIVDTMASIEDFDGILADSIWVRNGCPPRFFPLESLPNEVLLNITSYLDCDEAIRKPRLPQWHEPDHHNVLAKWQHPTLKALKRVSRKLEAIAIEEETRRLTFEWTEHVLVNTWHKLVHNPNFACKIQRVAASFQHYDSYRQPAWDALPIPGDWVEWSETGLG